MDPICDLVEKLGLHVKLRVISEFQDSFQLNDYIDTQSMQICRLYHMQFAKHVKRSLLHYQVGTHLS